MKIGIVGKWALGVGFVLLPHVGICLAEDSSPPPAQTPAITEQESTNALTSKSAEPSVSDATTVIDIANAPTSPITEQKTLPPNIHPARPLAEIIKLNNSGVEEGVMMAFVTNSPSTFNLSAEEIIYLKDIGVPDRVVTAMILRDQTLHADSVTALAAAAPPPSEPPVAPNASDVAPQPDATAAQYPPEPAVLTEVADDSQFYSTLAPYGNWVNVGGYGACWQPTVVVANPGWAPYYNCGRWIWTDCGWYWCSYYSWGWAPFHYGRWFCHSRLGWCWAPDRVWGPSWVSWRYTDGYCGWAPLPPGTSYAAGVGLTFHGHPVGHGQDLGLKASNYRFVAWNHFKERDFQHYRLPPHQQDQLFTHSVIATKFTGDGRNIANDGLPPQKVAAATGTQVRRVAIREVDRTSRSAADAVEHYDPNGRTVTVYRPNFGQTSTAGSAQGVPRSGPASNSTRTLGNFAEPVTGYAQTAPSQPPARPAQPAPLILHGPQDSAIKETPPPSSLVIIGRKDPNGSQTFFRSTVPSASSRGAPTADNAPSQRSWTDSATPSPTPWADNELARETPNETWHQSTPATANPGYRPPAYVPRNANPTYYYDRSGMGYRSPASPYQAPARSAPADVPRYAPPSGNNVQRSYSPPPAAPAPARPAPAAPSAPAQSSSSGRSQR
jgi:hypothetical protein